MWSRGAQRRSACGRTRPGNSSRHVSTPHHCCHRALSHQQELRKAQLMRWSRRCPTLPRFVPSGAAYQRSDDETACQRVSAIHSGADNPQTSRADHSGVRHLRLPRVISSTQHQTAGWHGPRPRAPARCVLRRIVPCASIGEDKRCLVPCHLCTAPTSHRSRASSDADMLLTAKTHHL